MITEDLETGQAHLTKEILAEAVKEVFAKPAEFADKCRNMPTKLVLYILVLVVCAMITMIWHQPAAEVPNADTQE